MLKNYLLGLLLATLLGLASVSAKPVFAAVTCIPQYGGGQTCVATGQLMVNKRVLNTVTDGFRFQNGDEVSFAIDVKNVGDAVINNITVTDTLPSFLTLSGGDPLVSTIDSLSPGQTVTKTIKAKVNTTVVTCQLNVATATSGSLSDRGTAQVCAGVPPPVTPPTGPEDWPLILSAPVWLGSIGWYLKKLTSRGVNSK